MAKNDNVKFWWIKLETNFFYQNAIDFLMGQKNGSDYVVLYQMLCLSTANTDGVLMNQIGDILVKYDIDKIQRDTKYFHKDTIIVALELYKKLGLIYEESNGFLKIANYNKMVDSTTFGAVRKKEERNKNVGDILGTNVPKSIELRDKNKDIKDKDLKEEKDIGAKPHTSKFIPPTLEEVIAYCKERNNDVDAERFINFYTSKGWLIGKAKMKDWKASVRTWEKTTPKQEIRKQRGTVI